MLNFISKNDTMINQLAETPFYGQETKAEKVINNYLSMETSYALLVNGRRGIGKTYFIKNRVIPMISKSKVFHDHRKSYKPVFMSLYGIKSIDEIYTLLAIEFMPWLKNKDVKITLSIGKLVARGILNLTKGGDVDTYLKDLSATAKNGIDTKEFVMIFDDLDRMSASLEVEEVIGFINSLVEHDNNKIIVIADQEQFVESSNYIAVREKTVGTIVEFTTTFNESFDSIIITKYQRGFRNFFEYLVLMKPDILYWFGRTDTSNLRTLIYFLQHFHFIFSELYVALKIKELNFDSIEFRKLKAVLHFSVSISIEFKKGHVSFRNPNEIDNMRVIGEVVHLAVLKKMYADHLNAKPNAPSPPQKPYYERFIENYYPSLHYYFYSPLFNYITGGDAFELAPLVQQLKVNFDDREYNPSPQELVYMQLSESSVLNLTNSQYIRLTNKMLKFAIQGCYPLDRYLSILFYIERYPEIKFYDIREVTERLIAGVKRNRKGFVHDEIFTEKFGIEKHRKNYQFFLDLFRVLNEINTSIRTEKLHDLRAQTFELFKANPNDFYQKTYNEYHDIPIFAHWNFKKFYAIFNKLPTSDIPQFTKFLKDRYGQVLIKDELEYFFLLELFGKVKIHRKGQTTLREIKLRNLEVILDDIIVRNVPITNKN